MPGLNSIWFRRLSLGWFKSLGSLCLWLAIQTVFLKTLAKDNILPLNNTGVRSDEHPTKLCPQELPTAIEEIIHRPQLKRSRWGIQIQTLNRGLTLYSLNAEQYFIPASSAKLLTTAAVLLELGADYRIYTPIYGEGKLPHLNSLRIEGRGDPTITTQSLKSIVHQLRDLGVQKIDKLIVDDSYFPLPTINPTWEWLDVYSYFATSVNSLILNQNTVTLTLLPQQLGQPVKLRWSDAIAARQWRVENQAITAPKNTVYNVEIDGSLGDPVLNIRGELAIDEPPDIWDLAVVNPTLYFLESWRLLLNTENINVTQGQINHNLDDNRSARKLAAIASPPLRIILNKINRESNNLYAEALIKILAKKLNTATAIEAVEPSLNELGINSKEYFLVDGSGLSRHNLITPKTVVKTLNLMSRSPQGKVYRDSLALAGVNGTLKKRFRDTSIAGNLWGKTGTLTGVATLAGYLNLPQFETLVFNITVNNSDRSSKELRQAIDEIIFLLARLKQC